LEKSLGELERYRAIFNLAIDNPVVRMPETVWKSYIDNEISLKEYDLARELYEKLLHLQKHYKVWSSFAEFEAELNEVDKCR
jgi:crooked neck